MECQQATTCGKFLSLVLPSKSLAKLEGSKAECKISNNHSINQLYFTVLSLICMLLHAFYGKGGPRPPFIFQRGGLFEKRGGGGGQIFFVRPLPQKLILHHIDTFVMHEVSWIGSKQSNEIIIFMIITEIIYSMIYDVILMIELTSDFSLHTIRFSSIYINRTGN